MRGGRFILFERYHVAERSMTSWEEMDGDLFESCYTNGVCGIFFFLKTDIANRIDRKKNGEKKYFVSFFCRTSFIYICQRPQINCNIETPIQIRKNKCTDERPTDRTNEQINVLGAKK